MSAILKALAAAYRDSQLGRTGAAARQFGIDYKALLKAARSEDGEALATAERELREAAKSFPAHIRLETPRDNNLIYRVCLTESGEAWLFAHLGESSPTQRRLEISQGIIAWANESVPAVWQEPWQAWCHDMAERARHGRTLAPLSRDDAAANAELLRVLVRLLNWRGESLVRFASCVLCGHSKRLGELQDKLEACLKQISGKETSLKDFGILDHPRQVLLHGPLRLILPAGPLDLGLLQGPVALSETDLQGAADIICSASRCLTVENEATFRELAKFKSDTLLVHTSYPGRAVRLLLSRLPVSLPLFHFGDTDPAGFEILRDLQVKLDRAIAALHMQFRADPASPLLTAKERDQTQRLLADPRLVDVHPSLRQMLEAGRKGRYEQEALGPPAAIWPFY
ncbi:MAG TPA: Wadjet anti-phage system protein JetD domain-containing protein [Prosthecobacter sp.]|nr:Wadjet anti-phage system protein JetD domain-containing protein [Prosthecobacter sp.]